MDDLKGFYKVDQNGSIFITATFYNPETNEQKIICVRDYDYFDKSRDNDELYFMPINNDIKKMWLHSKGIITTGDTIKVIKGRKIKIGTIGTVKAIKAVYDKYNRWVADYIYLEDGQKTNINNCVLI